MNGPYLPENPALRPDALTLRVCDVSIILSENIKHITMPLRHENISSKSSQQKFKQYFTDTVTRSFGGSVLHCEYFQMRSHQLEFQFN